MRLQRERSHLRALPKHRRMTVGRRAREPVARSLASAPRAASSTIENGSRQRSQTLTNAGPPRIAGKPICQPSRQRFLRPFVPAVSKVRVIAGNGFRSRSRGVAGRGSPRLASALARTGSERLQGPPNRRWQQVCKRQTWSHSRGLASDGFLCGFSHELRVFQ